MNPNCTHNNELSLDDAAELLAEVRLKVEASSSSNLYDFVGLLSELFRLCENQAAGEGEVELTRLNEFLPQALAEVRSVMNADSPNFERIDALYDQAIDQWGEQLVAMRENDDPQLNSEAWEFPPDTSTDMASAEDDEPEAPSADAIQALLSQLGAASPPEAAPPQDDLGEAQAPAPVAVMGSSETVPSQDAPSRSIVEIESLDPELREAFMDDASSCVSSMEASLLRLESDPKDAESLQQILRELHTLKGASGSVGLTALADHIHHLEDSLRDDQAAGRAPSIDPLLQSVDQIRSQITGKRPTAAAQLEPGQADPTTAEPTPAPVTTASFSEDVNDDELVRVKSSQLNRLMDMLAELVMLRNQRESELSELQDVYHELITSVSQMRLLSNEGDLSTDSSRSVQLSEVANDVLEAAQQLRDCTRPFADGNTAVSRFIRQFRQELVQLRRTPISGLFRRLQRVVRDAARAEAKQVRLTMLGEDAGIERSLQQRLYEPLLHIVRNSVCHGIENSEERVQNGKAPEGVVSLEAKSGPDLFVIEVRDDGRGLDYEAIRRRGVERGLLAADQAASREELSQLIFHPGFSTRESANQVGGRGVGMDVVAATLHRMRGWLEVESEPGNGTRIRLSFPLPSVIQHAMVFRCANQLFAVPMESVLAIGEVSSDIPQADFSRLLGFRRAGANASDQAIVVADDYQGAETGKASPLALFVDEIVGPEELVVRPLPALLKNHPFCVGATLSGMGQTVILLDARRVLQSQATPLADALRMPNQRNLSAGEPAPVTRSRVLVVDDSLSARKRVVRSLGRYPVDIVEATNGKEALDLLKKEKFAAIFSDMEMPNVGGMELLATVHSPDWSDPPPVVIISSRSEREFTDRARQLGAKDYLIKPLADEALDATLVDIASLRHLTLDTPSNQLEKNS